MTDIHLAAARYMAQQEAPKPTIPAPIQDDTLATRTESLLARIREASEAFETSLAACPTEAPCEHHTSQMAVLDVDKSWHNRKPVYACPACASDARAARRGRRLENAGIPRDVRHATLENFDTTRPNVKPDFQTPAQFIEAARKFVDGKGRNALLCGSPGIGKGHIAAAIAIRFLDSGRNVSWIDCSSLFSAWHEAYATSSTSDVRDRYAHTDLLILDEICFGSLPKDGEEILFKILDVRHKAELQTILLSNQPGPAIKAWVGGRIYDRLKTGGCLYRYGEWDSMRGTKRDGQEPEF